jgi:hypothetical protein
MQKMILWSLLMLHKILSIIMGYPVGQKQVSAKQQSAYQRAMKERQLIRRESKIGSQLFGQVPSGRSREFFCLDERTWVWSESWYDANTNQHQSTQVQYEFQDRGVLKLINKVPHGYITSSELRHLVDAIQIYHDRVAIEVYGPGAAPSTV